ncbi:MAG: hypothetical protein V4520_07715 [Bacteroidota bacterium]
MQVIKTVANINFPFEWVNLNYYPESDAKKIEIYLADDVEPTAGMAKMFDTLFGYMKYEISVYSKSWWNFCLDTWNVHTDLHNYALTDKSIETQRYLTILKECEMPHEYSGVCEVRNWKKFLSTILPCVTSKIATYSPIFFSEKHELFFYFHHTGSIGLYYRYDNNEITDLLKIAETKYDVMYN